MRKPSLKPSKYAAGINGDFSPRDRESRLWASQQHCAIGACRRKNPPDYVFLLNPDATLENEAIALLADFLDVHPSAACAGAEIRKPEHDAPVVAAFQFPGLASTIMGAVNLSFVARLLKPYSVPLQPTTGAERVDWVSGAAVLGRFSVWQDVGFFDPTYFLYFEEVDLMLQISRAGWECWYVPNAKVIHHEGASTGIKGSETVRRRRPAYLYQSWMHYFSKNHGRLYAVVSAFAWLIGGTLGLLIARLRHKTPSVPLDYAKDIMSYVIVPLLSLRR